MSKYGNIEGVATLTNNPNATDNAKGTIGEQIMKLQNASQILQKKKL